MQLFKRFAYVVFNALLAWALAALSQQNSERGLARFSHAAGCKWVATRSESMINDHHAREMVYYGELALDEHGKILALRSKSLFQMGAYFVGAALAAGAFSIRFVPAAYDIQTMHLMSQGLFTSMSAATQQQMIDLNILGLTAMISEFLPGMAERAGQGRRGHILNVASIAAFQPIPSLATYAASKAFVLSLTESLSEELKGTGVTVTALCPGVTATAMLSGAASANGKVSQLPAFMVGDVNEVARQGFEACMRGDVICVPGAINRAVTLGSRATPKWLVRKIGGLIVRNAL